MNAQNNFDISNLPGNNVEIASPPAAPAQPVVKTKKKAKKQAPVAPDTFTVTHELLKEEEFSVEALFKPVYEHGLVLEVTRVAWNGIRSRSKSKRLDGLRLRMRKGGYQIAAKVEAPDGNGRLASAVYQFGDNRLVITYGTAPGYGHTIKAIND